MYKRNTPHTIESLMERTHQEGDCHIWDGATTVQGYGVATYRGKQTTVHRLFYTLLIGEIPDGAEIDHTCNNRLCVNPAHLQAVTHQKNMELGAARRATCRNGHEWNEANTYVATVKRKQGGFRLQRYCRKCRAEGQAKRRTPT